MVPNVQIFFGRKEMSSIFLAKMNSVTDIVPSWQIERNTFAVATKKIDGAQTARNMLL